MQTARASEVAAMHAAIRAEIDALRKRQPGGPRARNVQLGDAPAQVPAPPAAQTTFARPVVTHSRNPNQPVLQVIVRETRDGFETPQQPRPLQPRQPSPPPPSSARPQMTEFREKVLRGVREVDRLVDQLLARTKEADTAAEAQLVNDLRLERQEVLGGTEPKEHDLLDEASTLRALASDDTSLETASVADYGADPPPAPAYSTLSILAIREEMSASCGKIAASLDVVRGILENSPHWWTSHIVMRRLKTHMIRANYHARKMKKWGNQCRAHLFVSSSILQRTSVEATAELADQRAQLATYEKRRERLKQKHESLAAKLDDLHAAGDETTRTYEGLAAPLQSRAAACAPAMLPAGSTFLPAQAFTPEQSEVVLLLAVLGSKLPALATHGGHVVEYLTLHAGLASTV